MARRSTAARGQLDEGHGAVVPVSRGFPPICGRRARVLILGSLPGQASLAAGQYYAQPRNAFWPIMGELLGAGAALAYHERCTRLEARGVAVWDVLAAGRRPGSLDAAIDLASAAANDFQPLLDAQPAIERICFNGAKAAELYLRLVQPTLGAHAERLAHARLPSTSPANATLSFATKLARWGEALAPFL